MAHIPIGKLPADLLRELLDKYVAYDPRVIVGPAVGVDAAIIDMGDRYLVAKTDPVTFASEEIGWYAVHVNANDVACCGARPRWYLVTLLLPEKSTTPELVESLFRQLSSACRELGVALCGGHTEITYGLQRPIVVGQMLGEVPRDQYVSSGGARVGDALILTKGITIEGTAIIAREKRSELRDVISESDLDESANLLHRPGISVVRDAHIALEVGGIHALHDLTEGGLATGLWELAEASGVDLVVDEHSLPILPQCETLCQHYGLDPLGLIGSGSLLIAADRKRAESIVEKLKAEGIDAAEIGAVMQRDRGCVLCSADGAPRPLPTFARDEIARLFE